MASVNSAQRSSGYVLGGISPLGQRRALPTVIHESAIEKSSIFVSGGKRGFDIEIEPNELARACNACFAAITR
jgi:Cys-tRNA(Pro)/Cys-tRNA(Cys) deacylase